jgi:hypothetical protein
MIRPEQFDRAIVNTYKPDKDRTDLMKFMGIDSEAYTDGTPFMFATAQRTGKYTFDKKIIIPKDLFETFFTPYYLNTNFVVFNIKYDAGAIIRSLPEPAQRELQKYDEAIYLGKYKIKYIRHKYMRISLIGKQKTHWVQFWDISQYYRMSLGNASQEYLSPTKTKLKQKTKNYTPKYVRRCWRSVSEYCMHDAQLTLELAEHFFSKLREMGLPIASIYSEASISAIWVNKQIDNLFTPHKWFKTKNKLLAFACEAYHGGKFEITARGSASVHSYDISSAYPYEICNLLDIKNAHTFQSKKYVKDAQYGFLRVKIDNSAGYYLPTGIPLDKSQDILIYPRGIFYATVTKQEYEYMRFELGIPVKIYDAEWLKMDRHRYPFRKCFLELYKRKSSYKSNKMLYKIVKILMNGYYGKMAQCIADKKTGKIKVGQDWNPIYAAIITANTRIRITRIQNELKNDCVAVHTDSVFVTKPLPNNFCKNTEHGRLGAWEKEEKKYGDAVIISCGQYQIGDSGNKFRGIIPVKKEKDNEIEKDSWKKILKRNGARSIIKYKQDPKPASWSQVIASNHSPDLINFFTPEIRTIDLNADKKRIWKSKTNAKKLLNSLEYSDFIDVSEFEPPEFWRKKLVYYLPKEQA